jgi:hypothetical protein
MGLVMKNFLHFICLFFIFIGYENFLNASDNKSSVQIKRLKKRKKNRIDYFKEKIHLSYKSHPHYQKVMTLLNEVLNTDHRTLDHIAFRVADIELFDVVVQCLKRVMAMQETGLYHFPHKDLYSKSFMCPKTKFKVFLTYVHVIPFQELVDVQKKYLKTHFKDHISFLKNIKRGYSFYHKNLVKTYRETYVTSPFPNPTIILKKGSPAPYNPSEKDYGNFLFSILGYHPLEKNFFSFKKDDLISLQNFHELKNTFESIHKKGLNFNHGAYTIPMDKIDTLHKKLKDEGFKIIPMQIYFNDKGLPLLKQFSISIEKNSKDTRFIEFVARDSGFDGFYTKNAEAIFESTQK